MREMQPVLDACICAKLLQLCLTLCDPMDCNQPGSCVRGILQARILEWIAMPSSRGIFPTQGSKPHLLYCRQMLYCQATREAPTLGLVRPKVKMLSMSAMFSHHRFEILSFQIGAFNDSKLSLRYEEGRNREEKIKI